MGRSSQASTTGRREYRQARAKGMAIICRTASQPLPRCALVLTSPTIISFTRSIEEARHHVRLGSKLGVEHFDGDVAFDGIVDCFVDLSHASSTDEAHDA